ncbi:hypothetical protein ACFV4P_34725 [Kitasatospora sp. NPDC059795]|uniref:hypothetical protein n=1 Tax=Kitasatospora sp. NPDC059795 TaxID=3346949 RepID=UPI00365C48A7
MLDPDEAAAFLRHGAEQYADQLADLFEVLLGTGMRRGEALALHWTDVHLMDRKLYVRWTLAAIDNGELAFGQPKTEASRAWISLSPRATPTACSKDSSSQNRAALPCGPSGSSTNSASAQPNSDSRRSACTTCATPLPAS